MLISCKCLNFIATSNNQQNQTLQSQSLLLQQQLPAATSIATADIKEENATEAAVAMQQLSTDCNNILFLKSSNINSKAHKDIDPNESFSITNALRTIFLQKYSRNFIFYSQCVDFFKQAIGPVPDLVINTLNQKDLIYSLTLEVNETENFSGTQSSWQLSICSNCNVVLCAKILNTNPPQFLINCSLLTNNEELLQKRSDKSFSDTFGLLIMDHSQLELASNNHNGNNSKYGSLSNSANSQYLDSRQLRLRQLQYNMHQSLQREIAETDDRIQRYTTQQFALLKSFREKSEQEYQMLVSLIQCIPDQQANELLEREPPAFDVFNNSGSLSFGGARRRNTISSRREINTTATTPTTPTTVQPPNNLFTVNRENFVKNFATATSSTNASAIITTATVAMSPTGAAVTATATTPTVVGNNTALNRKITNFDTPPATPESLPMSVGNSPTFRQQQQQITNLPNQQQTFQQQFPTPTIEIADDCLFELEGVDGDNVFNTSNNPIYLQNSSSPLRLSQARHLQSQNVPHQTLPHNSIYQPSFNNMNIQSEHNISDLEESDDAEEAEDALGLECSMPISTPNRRKKNTAQASSFAKSLPIEISISPRIVGRNIMATLESDDDELANNVDIAASIKALAKSAHGETVFGDLPRPRLRSQI